MTGLSTYTTLTLFREQKNGGERNANYKHHNEVPFWRVGKKNTKHFFAMFMEFHIIHTGLIQQLRNLYHQLFI